MNAMNVIIIVGPALCLLLAGYATILAMRARRSEREIEAKRAPFGIVQPLLVRIFDTFQFMPSARGYRIDIIDAKANFVGAIIFDRKEEMGGLAHALLALIEEDIAAAQRFAAEREARR